jgi:predicted nucleic acid-binding protein
VGEIRKGIERARDPVEAQALETWLATLSKSFGERILPVDHIVAEEWGRMSALRSVSIVDALQAATAKVHGLTLVTRNTSDVRDLGVDVLDPFQPIAGSPSGLDESAASWRV